MKLHLTVKCCADVDCRDGCWRGCTCPQTAWCQEALELPNQGWGGWTWKEPPPQGWESPRHIPPAQLHSLDIWNITQNDITWSLIIKNTCFKTGSWWLIDSPVRHCSRLLINELLRGRDKHADCAWCREKTSFCRTYKEKILVME